MIEWPDKKLGKQKMGRFSRATILSNALFDPKKSEKIPGLSPWFVVLLEPWPRRTTNHGITRGSQFAVQRGVKQPLALRRS